MRGGPRYPPEARLLAGAIALLSWLALAWAAHDWVDKTGSLRSALVRASTFYTNWTGLAAAAVFTGIALAVRPLGRAAVIGNMLVLVVVLTLLYWGTTGIRGFLSSAPAEMFLHAGLPPMVVGFWLCFTPRRRMTRMLPPIWLAIPVAYMAHFLGIGARTGRYPYPTVDVGQRGLAEVMTALACTLVLALVAGYAIVALDERLREPAWRR
jgi:hypothetical protein